FIGKSPRILEVFETIRKTADSGSTVMITGESGTGKELVARAVHQESARRNQPFVSVNCRAIPETLMESELFGHLKGAFTGAVAGTEGLFAAADVGKSVRAISPESLAILERYHWPGNIRELENVVERAIVLGNGELLSPESLPAHVRAPRDERAVEVDIPPTGMDLEGTLTRIENRYIRLALERSGWLQIRAAELLGLSFRQFRYKLQKHGLRAGRGGPKPPVQS